MTLREALTIALTCIDDSRSLERVMTDNPEVVARYDEAEGVVKELMAKVTTWRIAEEAKLLREFVDYLSRTDAYLHYPSDMLDHLRQGATAFIESRKPELSDED